MTLLYELGHESIYECEHERSYMSTVNVGIGHDDDLVITEFADIEVIMDTGTESRDHRLDLSIVINPVKTGFLYIKDLSA